MTEEVRDPMKEMLYDEGTNFAAEVLDIMERRMKDSLLEMHGYIIYIKKIGEKNYF